MATEYIRSDRLVYRQIAGEHLLIDLRSKSDVPFFALTETAVPLWKGLAAWSTAEGLANVLRDEYEITFDEAVADVQEFLGQLVMLGGVNTRERES
jgi:hypothetical protein